MNVYFRGSWVHPSRMCHRTFPYVFSSIRSSRYESNSYLSNHHEAPNGPNDARSCH